MGFPSLIAHQVHPFVFNLGGRLSPISIRDQMVRAQMIVDDAAASGLIGEQRPLLVVGAGAAGASAAMWASLRYGVKTVLVEKDVVAFNRQGRCQTRWIDPCQYDWPVDHWQSGQCPFASVSTPLPWHADWSHQLAAGWRILLNRAVRRAGSRRLRVLYNTIIRSVKFDPDPERPPFVPDIAMPRQIVPYHAVPV